MKKINVCLSPALYHLYAADHTAVVLIDAIRASASICTAFMNDVECIVPVSEIEEAKDYKNRGFLTAGERDGDKIKGFDLGNSPESFTEQIVKGNKIALTTTNGTQIVKLFNSSKFKDSELLIGSFLNVSSLVNYLNAQKRDILLLCSGWKQTVNIEDTLLAGKITALLLKKDTFEITEATNLALHFFHSAKEPYYDFIMRNSPRLNSKSKQLENDFRYCLNEDITDVIPILEGNYLRV
jgi:2-phosphosulfolactate phosphatase